MRRAFLPGRLEWIPVVLLCCAAAAAYVAAQISRKPDALEVMAKAAGGLVVPGVLVYLILRGLGVRREAATIVCASIACALGIAAVVTVTVQNNAYAKAERAAQDFRAEIEATSQSFVRDMAALGLPEIYELLKGTVPITTDALSDASAKMRLARARMADFQGAMEQRMKASGHQVAGLDGAYADQWSLGMRKAKPLAIRGLLVQRLQIEETDNLVQFLLRTRGRYRQTAEGLVFDRDEDADAYNAIWSRIEAYEKEAVTLKQRLAAPR